MEDPKKRNPPKLKFEENPYKISQSKGQWTNTLKTSLKKSSKLTNIITCSLPGPVETTLNYPLVSARFQRVANGKIIWKPSSIFRGWSIFSPPYALYKLGLFTAKNVFYDLFPYKYFDMKGRERVKIPEAFLVGSLTGVVGAAFATPLEQLATFMNTHQIKNYSKAYKGVVGGKGIFGLWRGYVGTMWRDVGFCIGLFSLADILQDKLIKRYASGEYKNRKNLIITISRLTSGCVLGFLSTPFDTIKTYQQSRKAGEEVGFLKTAQLLRNTPSDKYTPKLLGNLFKGYSWRLARIGLGVFYLRTTYEFLEKSFDKKNKNY